MSVEKQKYKLLIVEDDKLEIDKYKDAIDIINDQSEEIEVLPFIFQTLKEGNTAIQTQNFDGAIIDIKLSSSATASEESGNHLIKKIINNFRFPIVAYSGFTGDIDPDISDEETCFFKIYKRTDKTAKSIIEELIKIHKKGIVKIIGPDGLINKYLNEIFWNHLARAVNDWSDIEPDNFEKMMLRYTVSHLQEYLEIRDDGFFELFHPYEMYIIPPIKNKPFTGCILKRDEKYFIILTPPCDLAQESKSKLAVIAEIEPLTMDYVRDLRVKIQHNDENSEKARNSLLGLIRNSNSLKYHFLPQCQSFNGGFINFQKIHYEKIKEIEDSYESIANISANYLKDIIARFSHYYSRQGQPDMDFDKIYNSIMDL